MSEKPVLIIQSQTTGRYFDFFELDICFNNTIFGPSIFYHKIYFLFLVINSSTCFFRKLDTHLPGIVNGTKLRVDMKKDSSKYCS